MSIVLREAAKTVRVRVRHSSGPVAGARVAIEASGDGNVITSAVQASKSFKKQTRQVEVTDPEGIAEFVGVPLRTVKARTAGSSLVTGVVLRDTATPMIELWID